MFSSGILHSIYPRRFFLGGFRKVDFFLGGRGEFRLFVPEQKDIHCLHLLDDIICSKTHLQEMVLCMSRPLLLGSYFASHMADSWPMKGKKKYIK